MHQLSAICPSLLYYVFVTNAIVLDEIAAFFVYLAGTCGTFCLYVPAGGRALFGM